MDKTDRISFSKSFDLAGQNNVLKDPGQAYIANTINIGRFLVDFWPILADVGRFLADLGCLFAELV